MHNGNNRIKLVKKVHIFIKIPIIFVEYLYKVKEIHGRGVRMRNIKHTFSTVEELVELW
jgi:hypothetical protein